MPNKLARKSKERTPREAKLNDTKRNKYEKEKKTTKNEKTKLAKQISNKLIDNSKQLWHCYMRQDKHFSPRLCIYLNCKTCFYYYYYYYFRRYCLPDDYTLYSLYSSIFTHI